MKNKLAVFLTALIVSFSSSAMAFEGFSIGATYSNLDFSTKGQETSASTTAALKSTDASASGSGDFGLIFAEYTFSQGSTIGIDYVSGSTEIGKKSRTETRTAGDGQGTTGTITASADIKNPMTIYVEPTFMFNDKFGVYVKGSATHVTVTPKETDAGAVTNSTYASKDVWGIGTGIGAKAYWNNFFVKAEYVETSYEKYSHQSTAGDKNSITADIDTEETRLSLGYNF